MSMKLTTDSEKLSPQIQIQTTQTPKPKTQPKSSKKRSGISKKIQSFSKKFSYSHQEQKRSKMVYSYTPTYYSTLHDSITSICKTILPFNFKKRRLPAAEQKLSKLQSDNLKWQQDSFHQMLNLMGLHQEGILAETEVAAFRSHLLETLIVSPPEQEQPVILRDKLLFLQELLYAKCISSEEYHSSKRPLLQRLAVQGAEIEARDVIVGALPKDPKEISEEEWSVIDLKEENCLLTKENLNSKNKSSKQSSAMKQIKGAASVFGFVSSYKPGKNKEEKSIFDLEAARITASNPMCDSNLKGKENEMNSILMPGSFTPELAKESGGGTDKAKRKPFKALFHREQRDGHGSSGGGGGDYGPNSGETASKLMKKNWGFDGFKKWSKNDSDDETAPLPLNERSDSEAYSNSCRLVASPAGEGPDTKLIKRKLHKDGAPSDFFIDKVLGDKIKKELSRIQSELSTTNPNLKFSDDQIEAISTKLPVEKSDLNNFFPKSWCDRYGDVVLDVVKKEFKDHVGEMETMRNEAREKRNINSNKNSNSKRWTTFDDDDDDSENFHPNLFARKNDTFSDDHNRSKLSSGSAFLQDQNPFWSAGHGSSSMLA